MAAFTTCHSRLKLYESLDTLQQQVLYYDTDSVIYRWRPNQPSITTGDFLGDMTDELDGDVITEFVSGGAKNYGYLTRAGKVVCKVRGFTLNVRGSAILNFHTMKDNILSELNSPQDSRRHLNITTPHYFKQDLEKKQIQVVPRVKQYGLVFDKHVIHVATKSSYPYGYERIGDELGLLLDLQKKRRDVIRTSHTSRLSPGSTRDLLIKKMIFFTVKLCVRVFFSPCLGPRVT